MNTPNRVDADPERIAAEIDAAVANAEASTTTATDAAAPVAEVLPPSAWAPLAPGIVQLLDVFVWPAWKLTEPENTALAEALPPMLDDLFPGGIGSPRWAPYFRVGFVLSGIVISRIDRKTGTLPPLREPPPPEKGATDQPGRNPDTVTAAELNARKAA